MSLTSQKNGNRTVHLRERALNTIAGWDDVSEEPNAVFLAGDIQECLVRLEQASIQSLDHIVLDGGLLVRFRYRRDADAFRQSISG
jgi:hypothetical protein